MLDPSNEIVPVSVMKKRSSQTNYVNNKNISVLQCKDLSSSICILQLNILIINEPCLSNHLQISETYSLAFYPLALVIGITLCT